MAYDMLIKNGTVVDGTGAPRFRADVAVADGKIAEVGTVADSAARVIDAADLIVAPGFVDPHTHYDAQICWDPLITSSSWHGVTSLVMGNCGVGLAPCKPESHEIAAWDLVNVEAIPFDVLGKGVTWDWQTFPEYMDAAARRGSGINIGFMAALTPFRHFVMGEESMDRAATPEETARIKALIKEAVAAGAFGFSTTNVAQHIGYQGRPIACRQASRDELTAYCNALRELDKGVIELALTNNVSIVDESEHALLDMLLAESGRPVTWLALLNRDDQPDATMNTLRAMEPLFQRGAVPQVTCRPLIIQIDLRKPFIFANLPCWKPAFDQPVEQQQAFYRDANFRAAFRKEMERPKVFTGKWERAIVHEAGRPDTQALIGKSVAEIAEQRGRDGLDTFSGPVHRGRPATPIHLRTVQRGRGPHPRTDYARPDDGRPVRRRGARGHAVRRRVLHLSDRHLGARPAGHDPGARGETDHLRARDVLRHDDAGHDCAGLGRGFRHLRLRHHRLGAPRGNAQRPARRGPAPGDARAGRPIHDRERRGALRGRHAHRRHAGPSAALGPSLGRTE